MTCRELVEFLMQYLDGGLAADQRRDFEGHLAVCPWCVTYVKQYQDSIRLGKAALAPSDDEIPAEVPEELVRAILSARQKA